MVQYTSEVDDPAVFDRYSRLPPAVPDEVLESPGFTTFSLFHFAFNREKNREHIFSIPEKLKVST